MAGTTTPDNLPYPDNGDNYNVTAAFQALAEATQIALDDHQIYSYRWDDSSGRTAETGMRVGDLGYQVDTDTLYRYDGTSWQVWVVTARDWTPTVDGLTAGSSTVVANYSVTNGVADGSFTLTGGSGASITGALMFSLPVLPHASFKEMYPIGTLSTRATNFFLGQCSLDTDTSKARLMMIQQSTTATNVGRLLNISNNNVPDGFNITSTSHHIQVNFRYRAA